MDQASRFKLNDKVHFSDLLAVVQLYVLSGMIVRCTYQSCKFYLTMTLFSWLNGQGFVSIVSSTSMRYYKYNDKLHLVY